MITTMTTQHVGTPQRLPIDDLTPYHENPRRGDVSAIADSLRAHGQFRPLVVNRGTDTGRPWEVLAGNHTLMAALSLDGSGHEFRTLDCYVVDVDADEARRIVLADNRTSDLGAYDDAALLDMLQGMDDLTGTGYDDDALADLLDGMADEDERVEYAAGALADDDDTADSGAVGAADGTAGDDAAPVMEAEAARRTLAERFLVPPFTVIDTRSGRWATRKRAWLAQGIRSTVGRGESLTFRGGMGKYANWMKVAGKARAVEPGLTEAEIEEKYADDLRPAASGTGTSEFDPVLAELLYTWFTGPGYRVLDPWAGGSVRGIVAAALGREYVGCELRPEQVDANRQQWETTRGTIDAPTIDPDADDDDTAPAAEGSAEWITGDSRATIRQMDTADPFDFVIGCPPYYDLEEYSDDPADLSNMTTDEFDAAMIDTLRAADALLAPNSYAAFVVGSVRDKRGHLRDMKMLMIRAAEEIGWDYVNDAVLLNSLATAAVRAGRAFDTNRTMTRVHQDMVIFVKGDRRAAAKRCGPVEIADLTADDDPEEE